MHARTLTPSTTPGEPHPRDAGPRIRLPHPAVSEHRAYLALASAAIAAGLLLSLAGCQTPAQPTYGNGMVPPPATGQIGQPAAYGPVGAPQVSYAQTPMPGPANSWQGAAPAGTPPPPATTGYPAPPPAAAGAPVQPPPPGSQPPPITPAGSTWGWTQGQAPPQQPPPQQPPPQQPPPTYGNPAQPMQQNLNAQAQQFNNQAQAATNQFQNGVNPQAQQYSSQMPQQQTTNGSWWPFSDPNAVPPARSTPAPVPKY